MTWPTRKPAGRIAYVDGRYLPHGEAGVHVEDRGLQLGDSIYEVCRIKRGRFLDEALHLDRLERSLREIHMAMPMPRASLAFVLAETARRNGIAEGLLYIQITRGAVRRDHPIPAKPPKPTLIVTVHRLDTMALARRQAEGIRIVTEPDQRWARCDIKSTQLLANLLAKTEARKTGAYEVWFTDIEGFITEGASTTAWIVDGEGRLITRPLSPAVLPGVTRHVLLRIAAEAQIPVLERAFTPAEAKAAKEAFITSASAAGVPVVAIDGAPIGDGSPGPVTRRLAAIYNNIA